MRSFKKVILYFVFFKLMVISVGIIKLNISTQKGADHFQQRDNNSCVSPNGQHHDIINNSDFILTILPAFEVSENISNISQHLSAYSHSKGGKGRKEKLSTVIQNVLPGVRPSAELPRDIANYLKEHKQLCLNDWKDIDISGVKPLCDCIPDTLLGFQAVNTTYAPPMETVKEATRLEKGGHWEPEDCTARYNVVVIIPFRDRLSHLSILLHYLHPKLMGQQLNYTILVVEQNSPKIFNKAALMNIGYKYAKMKYDPDCVIFNDVDTIPEDGRHFYTCRYHPLHLGAYNNRHMYKILYKRIFGAVTAFRPSTFEKLNGFSNRFFGWGGEDDDMAMRIRENGFHIMRDPRSVAGNTIIPHKRDKGNIQKNKKGVNRKLTTDRHPKKDGLNTLKYVFKEIRLSPLYTQILVDVLN